MIYTTRNGKRFVFKGYRCHFCGHVIALDATYTKLCTDPKCKAPSQLKQFSHANCARHSDQY